MHKPVLPFLETMVTQACNLSCVGCTNYSDVPHKGYVSWADLKTQLTQWLTVIDIPDFGIMGGEPLLNPEIQDILLGVRELMPDSQIRFTTNGKLLYRHERLLDLIHSMGNVVFKISVHQPDAKLERTIGKIRRKFSWTPVTEYGIDRWVTGDNIRLQINRPTEFIKTYRNTYHNMLPYDSVPADSFDLCIQKTCPLLHAGRIYKCSTQALLPEILHKAGDPNLDQWSPYISAGLSPDSDAQEILQFVNNFGKPQSACRMCPDAQDHEARVPHQINVSVQKNVRFRRKVLR